MRSAADAAASAFRYRTSRFGVYTEKRPFRYSGESDRSSSKERPPAHPAKSRMRVRGVYGGAAESVGAGGGAELLGSGRKTPSTMPGGAGPRGIFGGIASRQNAETASRVLPQPRRRAAGKWELENVDS